MFKKIVIFGVGLIGGSVALALKQHNNPPLIVGVGRQSQPLEEALALGIIDVAENNLANALDSADVVVIATPVAQMPAIFSAIQPFITAEMAITDAGSTKSDVLAAANQYLGVFASQFVGAHPIAGAEKSGPQAAFATLFQQKNIVITPESHTATQAVERVKALWQACGGVVSSMTAQSHDSVFAAVSHLPHVLAFALVDTLAKRPDAEVLFQFAASGFRDFTRIAGSHPEMWRDIVLANQSAILDELTAYQAALTTMSQLIASADANGLYQLFAHASHARSEWALANS